ncbi:hypothetical protein BN946_scf185012.g3 [Trametes cinnabarina]|uniref:F-box domain-containing protein n=1 Tax=Pycnoporus cinnabarinus TaxID=5643 RepID=A0A060SMJ0_PYCCI|nr:hypothetical protein BN946_scf185012.g3 [Trametes cinnabarina]
MSPTLLTLPDELLSAILFALDRHLPTLRNVSLTCRALLSIARGELFQVVDATILHKSVMLPYVQHVEELHFKPSSCPRPASLALSKLRTMHLASHPFRPMILSVLDWQELFAVAAFASVTELILYTVSLPRFGDLQSLVCLFPNLERFSASQVTLGEDTTVTVRPLPLTRSKPTDQAVLDARRPMLRFLHVAHTGEDDPVIKLARWLLTGPSAGTLKTLILSYTCSSPQTLLSHVGPTIEHLALALRPFHGMVYDGYFERYTRLHTLDLMLRSYRTAPGAWHRLATFLLHIPTAHLHTLMIDIRVHDPRSMGDGIYLPTLAEVNEALDDEKFATVKRVEVVVQCDTLVGWEPDRKQAEQVRRDVRALLYHVENAGKLVVTVQSVEKASAFLHVRSGLARLTDVVHVAVLGHRSWVQRQSGASGSGGGVGGEPRGGSSDSRAGREGGEWSADPENLSDRELIEHLLVEGQRTRQALHKVWMYLDEEVEVREELIASDLRDIRVGVRSSVRKELSKMEAVVREVVRDEVAKALAAYFGSKGSSPDAAKEDGAEMAKEGEGSGTGAGKREKEGEKEGPVADPE